VPQREIWPLHQPDDLLGESEGPRIRREFWDAVGSGQAGLALLVIGVLAAAVAAWIAQANELDATATVEWAVGLGLGIPLVMCITVFFRIAFRVPRRQRDEARAAYVRQREAAEANLILDLADGVGVNEIQRGALLQPKLRVRNTGIHDAPVHNWRAVLRLGDQLHELDHLIGQEPLHQSHQVPFLDRIGPLRPGLTAGHLHFVVPGVRQYDLNSVLTGTSDPVVLTITAYGPVQRWEGELDLRAKHEESHRSVAGNLPAEQMRKLSRKGHELALEIPAAPTPAQLARFEPRIDRWAAELRELIFAEHPEFLGELDRLPFYRPASVADMPIVGDPGAADVYLNGLLAILDRAIRGDKA
jgi:hypothetical protein